MNDEVLALLALEVAARNYTHAGLVEPFNYDLHRACLAEAKKQLVKLDEIRGAKFDNEASLKEFIQKIS